MQLLYDGRCSALEIISRPEDIGPVSQAISNDSSSEDLQTSYATGLKFCRFANDRSPQPSVGLTFENEREQVMSCLPLRLPLATELLIR
jgi:hypothetical protein